MASEQSRQEFSLVETQNKLNFYKNKMAEDPNPTINKWVEIYLARLEKIKQQLSAKR